MTSWRSRPEGRNTTQCDVTWLVRGGVVVKEESEEALCVRSLFVSRVQLQLKRNRLQKPRLMRQESAFAHLLRDRCERQVRQVAEEEVARRSKVAQNWCARVTVGTHLVNQFVAQLGKLRCMLQKNTIKNNK